MEERLECKSRGGSCEGGVLYVLRTLNIRVVRLLSKEVASER